MPPKSKKEVKNIQKKVIEDLQWKIQHEAAISKEMIELLQTKVS